MSANALLDIIAGRDTQGLFEFRCLNPRGGPVIREWFNLDDRAGAQRFIAAKSRNLDVYVGVAPRIERAGGTAAIRHSWLLYVDADSAEAAARVRAFTPRPSLIVRSGTGDNVHAYWQLSHPIPPAWFERANRRLAHHLGADVKATDAARILRPPWTFNHKTNPPARVEIELTTDSVSSVAALVKNLPDPQSNPPARKPRPNVFHDDDPLLGISADHYYAALTGRPVTRGNVQCPFHADGKERTPSMSLYERTYYCFTCCEGGGIYQFGSRVFGIETRGEDFKRLRERLSDVLA